jgi:class 3 adenylate cyclase/tetratricopeptide (TPR) repeat protein
MNCPSCGAANAAAQKFCGECGTALASICGTCGEANAPGQKFCGECGAALLPGARPLVAGSAPRVSERRVVSVLFADLVGFTAASESRDAEDTRELLTRYFDLARTLVTRYGGTLEKFIGDAVMAVWGTPTAREDDAERAVRAALDLVAAVPDLDPKLHARAGVLTGEAAVALGAEGQGMVAGDLVNTASRIQAAAEPGIVLVGEATKRASEAAIAYEGAGLHELKGKAEPVELYRALRVTAGRAGALKSVGLEPPLVGRDRELRLIKELFHASADEHKAHLVSLIGVGGHGKSRLVWEFFKYIDGVAEQIAWHRGRCLAYGEGVTYWALAEMVRMRADIVEGEEIESAREKLRAAVEQRVPDSTEREWVEPRLAHLLGLEERQVHEREDLFAGWRLFFERMAENDPVVLVFDDMQWADASLLDFVEYLLEWSRSYPIFIVTLARPDLVERYPQWGAGKRSFTSLSLEPLPEAAMEALIEGFVPGLPDELRARILERAEGVPLYAVETVRMLLDRGLVAQEGSVYRPTGPIEALDVPETLHALIAARLDGLQPDERQLLQDASVIGKTFTKQAVAAVGGETDERLDPLLASLVRKEVLSIQSDPRSPERGQYGFLQDLVRFVAYETLAKRDRKVRHLLAAAYLEELFGAGELEVVEVVASHYLAAYEAAPDDDDAAGTKAKAVDMLRRAGERAASFSASEEAERYFAQAATLADDPRVQAELYERSGVMAIDAARLDEAQAHYTRAIELFEGIGATHPAARASARLGDVEWRVGRIEAGIERAERAFKVLSADEPDADFVALAAQLGRLHSFRGNLDRASELLEIALTLSEELLLPEILVQAMNSYGVISTWRNRPETAEALFRHSLKLALENDLPTPALRVYNNLADGLCRRDRYDEALPYYASGIALARKVGNRLFESTLLSESAFALMHTGRWDQALAAMAEIPEAHFAALSAPNVVPAEIEVARGRIEEARRYLALLAKHEGSADMQQRTMFAEGQALVLRAEGRYEEALAATDKLLDAIDILGAGSQSVKAGFVHALEANFALGRTDKVEELLLRIESLRPGELSPFLRAQAARVRGRLGNQEAFKNAAGIFREFGLVFWLAVTQLEHGESLVAQERMEEAEPLLGEARETFERLEAKPYLARLARMGAPLAAEPVTAPS